MNRPNTGIVVYLLLVLFAGVLIAEYLTATRDTTWVNEIEEFIKKENWEPDSEYIPLMDYSFFLIENGTEQYFYLYSQYDFIKYIDSLMNSLNRKLEESISEEMLEGILANNRVLELSLRFPFERGVLYINYYGAYFILKDKQGTGLEATIIVQEVTADSYKYNVWQITESSIW